MACVEEHESFLWTIYADEKEPDTKVQEQPKQQPESVVEGVPLHPSNPASLLDPPRSPWSTGLCACLGSNDEFCSSDLEVCLLGLCAPCWLYGSNMERLYPNTESTFANHSLSYAGLLVLGYMIFGCNALVPCFSYAGRSEMRRQFQLTGTGECLAGSCGGGASGEHRERLDCVGDLVTHYLCHKCALCQEGREIRRRRPHPGLFRPFLAMNVPTEQVMTP